MVGWLMNLGVVLPIFFNASRYIHYEGKSLGHHKFLTSVVLYCFKKGQTISCIK
ncbi:hypothetical protein HanOQP8_Chr11g0413621 [Helianthus annuus]|nr:hypothetical protein HanOQP8_Chr11g0413621 [Helianthus annuus]